MFDPIWEQIHSERQWLSPPHEEMVFWILRNFASNAENIKVLDIGCGQGASTIFLAQAKFQTTALDGSPSALRKLKQNLDAYNLSANIVCGEMSKLDCPDEHFDVVVDVASICMNNNCEEIFNEVARVTKPGGGLFSVMPSTDTDKTAWLDKGPVTYFEPNKIRQYLAKHFYIGISYKCLEPEDKSKRISHWLVAGIKHS